MLSGGSVSPGCCCVAVVSPFPMGADAELAAVPVLGVRMLLEEDQTVAGDVSDFSFPFNYKADL